jgi:hypothetical protein
MVISYTPEMGQKRPDDAEIDAQLSHYGKHYFLDTPLTLSGRGVLYLCTYSPEQLTGPGQRKAGWHHYKVTIAAYERICEQYTVAYESLLD